MKPNERDAKQIGDRLTELDQARAKGRKVVGHIPGGYLPEELVLACGAIPLGLTNGGEHEAVQEAGAYLCRWIDPFCRAQIGYGTREGDPFYSRLDLLVVPITDNHVRGVSDVLSHYSPLPVFPYGVPHKKDPPSLAYYLAKLRRFKERLEALTGVEITAERLKAAIELCNRERELFRGISLKRRAEPCPLPGREFMDLHHASYLLDKEIMIGRLEETLRGLDEPRHEVIGPRVMLTGSTLARGDFKAPDLVIEAGGRIVVEEFAEGLRPYWFEVDMEGDPLAALAEAYFMRRVPPAWFRPGRERLDFLVDLARDFNVDGVVWYQLMFRESYKIESGFFPDILRRETGLSMLVLESDYDDGETGAMRTRIETYMQTIGR